MLKIILWGWVVIIGLPLIDFDNMEHSHELGRIYDIINSRTLSKHNKIVNIFKLVSNEPIDLPPLICSCRITLKNGEQHIAYLEQKKPPYYYKDDEDTDLFMWKIEHKNILKRKVIILSDVVKWEFI